LQNIHNGDKVNKKVVVGMSGGVDSSVSALLLKQQGYDVIGLFMKNWDETDSQGKCSQEQDYDDVRKVCDKIGIPYYTLNYAKEYYEKVFKIFLSELQKGRTPNPDVLCNKEIKFGPFLDFAKKIGADFVATGHYAGTKILNNWTYLLRSKDENKDQTYFLNQLNQSQLKDIIFPLKDILKTDVRKIAEKNNLMNFNKKDSTGICFIGERNFRNFLKDYLPIHKGDIIDVNGNKVGTHSGSFYYTIGQRRGLGIGGVKIGEGRWFVLQKDVKNNLLIVSQKDESLLYHSSLLASDFNWIIPQVKEKFECLARFRHRQILQRAIVTVLPNLSVIVDFKEKQRAIAEGQYVVLYDNEKCFGGGVIDRVFN